ncbi:MAG: hypothetical protein U0S12_06725 [Fimbriimonadales bacterium]
MTEKRLEANQAVLETLSAAERVLSPVAHGTKTFEPPLLDRLTGKVEENPYYEAAQAIFAQIHAIIVRDELALGKTVVQEWYFFRSAFHELEFQLDERRESGKSVKGIELFYAMYHMTFLLVDRMRIAIKDSLSDAEFTLLATRDANGAWSGGAQWFKWLLADIGTNPEPYSLESKTAQFAPVAKKLAKAHGMRA